MKPKALALATVVAVVLAQSAPAAEFHWKSAPAPAAPGPATQWEHNSKLWRNLVTEPKPSPGVQLGRSNLVLGGPLITTFRPRPGAGEASLGQKILNFPVVNLFVPQRMPSPPGGGGRYFAWGESSRPWASVGQGAPAGSAFSPVNNPANGDLISVSW